MSMTPTCIVDLSHRLDSNVQIYPGDPPFRSVPCATVVKDGYSVHTLSLGSHTGTHMDAPSHFFADGKTIDQIPLSSLFGSLVLVDLAEYSFRERQKITWADIEEKCHDIAPGVTLVLRTGWSQYWGSPKYLDHPFIAREAAVKLVEKGVHILGVDTMNPDETHLDIDGGADFGVHETILGAGGIIVENLTNLDALRGQNRIAFTPLNIVGCDGSPVRAFAWQE